MGVRVTHTKTVTIYGDQPQVRELKEALDDVPNNAIMTFSYDPGNQREPCALTIVFDLLDSLTKIAPK